MSSRYVVIGLAAVLIFSWPYAGVADERQAWDEALALAQRLDDSEEGQAYEMEFFKAVGQQLQQAMSSCTNKDTPNHPFRLLFQIEGEKIKEVLPEPGQVVAGCVAPQLAGLLSPSAPAEKWVVSIRMTVRP